VDFKERASPEIQNWKFALREIKEENKSFTYAVRKENKEKEKNKEKEEEQVVHKFNHASDSRLPYTWGSFLHDFGFTLASLVTVSLTLAGVIAAVLHDYSLAKSLIEAGGVIWWVGFFMMILGGIKREKEDWLFG